jgi:hypothetical protein
MSDYAIIGSGASSGTGHEMMMREFIKHEKHTFDISLAGAIAHELEKQKCSIEQMREEVQSYEIKSNLYDLSRPLTRQERRKSERKQKK